MKRKLSILCLLLSLAGLSQASDAQLDPTGTWKQINPPAKTRETTFTLKLQGATLTGAVLKSNGSLAITNGVVKGDQVSFQTRHEASYPKGTMVTESYSGTLSGDTITGKLAIKSTAADYGSSPWQIKRQQAKQ